MQRPHTKKETYPKNSGLSRNSGTHGPSYRPATEARGYKANRAIIVLVLACFVFFILAAPVAEARKASAQSCSHFWHNIEYETCNICVALHETRAKLNAAANDTQTALFFFLIVLLAVCPVTINKTPVTLKVRADC